MNLLLRIRYYIHKLFVFLYYNIFLLLIKNAFLTTFDGVIYFNVDVRHFITIIRVIRPLTFEEWWIDKVT